MFRWQASFLCLPTSNGAWFWDIIEDLRAAARPIWKWVACAMWGRKKRRLKNCASFFLHKIIILFMYSCEQERFLVGVSLLKENDVFSWAYKSGCLSSGRNEVGLLPTRGLCSPLILLFRTEPRQWGRWELVAPEGLSGVCLSFGRATTILVRLKLNLQGLLMQGFFPVSFG